MTAGASRTLSYGRHTIDEDDIAAVVEVLRSDFLTTGPVIRRFEETFADKVEARYAVACSSGTAALHLAAMAVGLGPGDVAIVPAITFLATANAVRFTGAEVVFADVDPETGLMRPKDLLAAIEATTNTSSNKLRAVLPVHLNGQSANMPAIGLIAKEYGLTVIEDACHAVGGAHDEDGSDPIGACAHSQISIFSGHPVKTFTMGEGGVVTTNDEELRARISRYRNHGMVGDPDQFQNQDSAFADDGQVNSWHYEMHEIGYNYRASDIHCALGLSQLGKLDRFVAHRRRLVNHYRERLKDLAPAVQPLSSVPYCQPAWHLAVVLVDFAAVGVDRGAVMRALRMRNVGSQVLYIPVYRQPYYHVRYGEIRLEGAERYFERCLALPLSVGMTERDVDFVVDALAQALKLPSRSKSESSNGGIVEINSKDSPSIQLTPTPDPPPLPRRGKPPYSETVRGTKIYLERIKPGAPHDSYLRWLNDPEVIRFLQVRFEVRDDACVRDFIASFDHVNSFLFGIYTNDEQEYIGNITLRANPHHLFAHMGYLIGEKGHWAGDTAIEAVRLICDFAFFERGLRKIFERTTENHLASNFNFRRLGFTYEGKIPDLYWGEGKYHAATSWTLSAAQWAEKRGSSVNEMTP